MDIDPFWIAAIVVLAVLALALWTKAGRYCAIALLLWLDRVVNVLLGGIYNETLSSRAHRMREKGQPVWGWTADAIDTLFFWQPGHCEAQWRREVLAGWHE
ncbi:MAG: hypothetical protein KA781_01355 [Aquabacterium sp.]|nr:hypothetical protein [Aquabacterium sp.]MBP8190349.1 hypothetical protein [Aquabacterium sp.]